MTIEDEGKEQTIKMKIALRAAKEIRILTRKEEERQTGGKQAEKKISLQLIRRRIDKWMDGWMEEWHNSISSSYIIERQRTLALLLLLQMGIVVP